LLSKSPDFQGCSNSTTVSTKGAQTRLRLALDEALKLFTNLTSEARIKHIVGLLVHFEILSDDGDPDDAVRRAVRGKTRTQKERDILAPHDWSLFIEPLGGDNIEI